MIPQELLETACDRFGYSASQMTPAGGSQNDVFAETGTPGPGILRISHDRHRTATAVEAELQWILQLADSGLPVCRPRQSRDGLLVETTQASGMTAIVTSFDHAPGRKVECGDLSS